MNKIYNLCKYFKRNKIKWNKTIYKILFSFNPVKSICGLAVLSQDLNWISYLILGKLFYIVQKL